MSLISAVIEQRASLLISGADALRRFGDDPYLSRIEHASVACVPLLKQNEVIGVLYLENTLTPRVFESTRLDVLELLTAQAAISLTNIDLRMARSELARTSQATILGELAASIAHEINQPLASILSNAGASVRWLQRDQPEIEMALEGLKDILAEGQRAAAIVSAMRSLAKQAPPERGPVDVGEVIRHVLTVTHTDIHERHVGVRLDLAPATLTYGDSTQLQQVMHNLITNAVEAMQALPASGRRLTITSHTLGNTLLVCVEDTGPGVSDEQQAHIFQAFYSTKSTGMGMGLAICSSILTAHGGTLRALHGRQGESLFVFTLPRCSSR